MADFKIKIVEDPATGEQCVPPECMRLLLAFAEHRNLCEKCNLSYESKSGRFCATGQALLDELAAQPEVEIV